MLSQLLAIAKNTFLESIRQPIMVVLIIAATVALTLSIAGAANTLEDDNVMFIQLGLSTLLLAGLFMAGFTATGVLSLEIERKTVLTVVSKPVTRPIFILGKYLGVATAITITMWPLAMIMLLCVRHGVMQTAAHDVDGPVLAFGVTLWFAALFASVFLNYMYRWQFCSTFVIAMNVAMTLAGALVMVVSKEWGLQSFTHEFTHEKAQFGNVMLGLLLLWESLLIFSAVAIVLSTRLGQVLTILLTVAIGYAMSLAGAIAALLQRAEPGANFLARAIHGLLSGLTHVVPNLDYLWVADDLTVGLSLSAGYIGAVSIYTALYVLALLALAVALFQNRDVG